MRCRLVAEILTRFWTLYQGLQTSNGQEGTRLLVDVRERYRNRCFLLGQDVMVTRGGESIRAHAVDLDESFRLVVKLPDGTRHALSYGEARPSPARSAGSHGAIPTSSLAFAAVRPLKRARFAYAIADVSADTSPQRGARRARPLHAAHHHSRTKGHHADHAC